MRTSQPAECMYVHSLLYSKFWVEWYHLPFTCYCSGRLRRWRWKLHPWRELMVLPPAQSRRRESGLPILSSLLHWLVLPPQHSFSIWPSFAFSGPPPAFLVILQILVGRTLFYLLTVIDPITIMRNHDVRLAVLKIHIIERARGISNRIQCQWGLQFPEDYFNHDLHTPSMMNKDVTHICTLHQLECNIPLNLQPCTMFMLINQILWSNTIPLFIAYTFSRWSFVCCTIK